MLINGNQDVPPFYQVQVHADKQRQSCSFCVLQASMTWGCSRTITNIAVLVWPCIRAQEQHTLDLSAFLHCCDTMGGIAHFYCYFLSPFTYRSLLGLCAVMVHGAGIAARWFYPPVLNYRPTEQWDAVFVSTTAKDQSLPAGCHSAFTSWSGGLATSFLFLSTSFSSLVLLTRPPAYKLVFLISLHMLRILWKPKCSLMVLSMCISSRIRMYWV